MIINRCDWWSCYTIGVKQNGEFYRKIDVLPLNEKRHYIVQFLKRYSEETEFVTLSKKSITFLQEHVRGLLEYDPCESVIQAVQNITRLSSLIKLLAPLFVRTNDVSEKALLLKELKEVPKGARKGVCEITNGLVTKYGWEHGQGKVLSVLNRIPKNERLPLLQKIDSLLEWAGNGERAQEVIAMAITMPIDKLEQICKDIQPFLGRIATLALLKDVIKVMQREPDQVELFLSLVEAEVVFEQGVALQFLRTPKNRRGEIVRVVKTLSPIHNKVSMATILVAFGLENLELYVEVIRSAKSEPGFISAGNGNQVISFLLSNMMLKAVSYLWFLEELQLDQENEDNFDVAVELAVGFYKDLSIIQGFFGIPLSDPLISRIEEVVINTRGVLPGPKHPVSLYRELKRSHANFIIPEQGANKVRAEGNCLQIQWNFESIQSTFREKVGFRMTNRAFFAWWDLDPEQIVGELVEISRGQGDSKLAISFVRKYLCRFMEPDQFVDATTLQLGVILKNFQHLPKREKEEHLLGMLHVINTCEFGALDNINTMYAELLCNPQALLAPIPMVVRAGTDRYLHEYIWNQYTSWVTAVLSGEKGEFLKRATQTVGEVIQAAHQGQYLKNSLSPSLGNFLWPDVKFDLFTNWLGDPLIRQSREELIELFMKTSPIVDFVREIQDNMNKRLRLPRQTLFLHLESIFDKMDPPIAHQDRYRLDEEGVPTVTDYGVYKILEQIEVIRILGERRMVSKRSRGD